MASNERLKAYQQGNSSRSGYAAQPQPGSPTYTEAWALIEAARRLANTIEHGINEDPKCRRDIRDALRLNWRLWTIFQSQLSVAESEVPDEIRVNMLSLCQFVDNHTVDAMAYPTPEKIVTLIDLNRNIASGLLESFSNAQQQQAETGQNAPQEAPAEPQPDEELEAIRASINEEA